MPRAAGIRQVWLVGTVTQICVEETAREAFRRGFEVVVVADAVTSYDPELHRATLRNLAAKFALVVDSAGIVEALGAIGHRSGLGVSERVFERANDHDGASSSPALRRRAHWCPVGGTAVASVAHVDGAPMS